MTVLTFNDLRRGSTYRATTARGSVTGEYLGIESHHGDHSILLRDADRTASIPLPLIHTIGFAAG